jgi:hypothetical protein
MRRAYFVSALYFLAFLQLILNPFPISVRPLAFAPQASARQGERETFEGFSDAVEN